MCLYLDSFFKLHFKRLIYAFSGTDPEASIIEAFTNFDLNNEGSIPEEELVRVLKYKKGNPLDDAEIQNMYKGNPPITGGKQQVGLAFTGFESL